MTYASFSIPLPPSVNGLFFNRPHGGRGKTTAYKNWRDEAGWEIRRQRVPFIEGQVGIDLIIQRPTASSDLDNRIKSSVDLLQHCHVIENDKLVVDLRARWGDVEGCRVSVWSAGEDHP